MIDPLERYLIDTNVLLRLSRQADPQHDLIAEALEELDNRGAELCFTLQNVAEFWNVCTRPADRNGYGYSIEETSNRVEAIEAASRQRAGVRAMARARLRPLRTRSPGA